MPNLILKSTTGIVFPQKSTTPLTNYGAWGTGWIGLIRITSVSFSLPRPRSPPARKLAIHSVQFAVPYDSLVSPDFSKRFSFTLWIFLIKHILSPFDRMKDLLSHGSVSHKRTLVFFKKKGTIDISFRLCLRLVGPNPTRQGNSRNPSLLSAKGSRTLIKII